MELKFDDRGNALALPAHGAVISVSIGYAGGQLVDKGSFTIDETEIDGPPDTITVHAKSSDMRESLKGHKSRAWTNQTTAQIVDQIAGENGLAGQTHPSLAGVQVAHKDQTNESDLHFLTRHGRDHDAIATVKGGKLIFAPKGAASSASGAALQPLRLLRSDLTSWNRRDANRSKFGSVRAKHRDMTAAALTDPSGREYVDVYSLPAITGSVSVTNFPSTQAVQGVETAGSAATGGGLRMMGSDGTNARDLATNTAGQLYVAQNAPFYVTSNGASGATDSGNPVKIGGVFTSSSALATPLTAGQGGDLQLSSRGSAFVTLYDPNFQASSTIFGLSNDGDAASNALSTAAFGMDFNGTYWDRNRSAVAAAGGTGTGVAASGMMATDGAKQRQLMSDTSGVLARNAFFNDTAAALAASAAYTGASHDAGGASQVGYSYFNAFFSADQAGTAEVDCSNDNSTFYACASQALAAGTPLILQVPVMTRYHRAKLTNGSTAQTALHINTSYTAS